MDREVGAWSIDKWQLSDKLARGDLGSYNLHHILPRNYAGGTGRPG